MATIKESIQYINSKKLYYYPISFVSFWIALLLQNYTAVFLADKVSATYLNISTIASMWVLATIILPITGSVLLVYFLIKQKSS